MLRLALYAVAAFLVVGFLRRKANPLDEKASDTTPEISSGGPGPFIPLESGPVVSLAPVGIGAAITAPVGIMPILRESERPSRGAPSLPVQDGWATIGPVQEAFPIADEMWRIAL